MSRVRRRESDSIVRVGRFDIRVPDESLLSHITSDQPYRNLAIGVIAKFVGERDATATIIDVGANVGGTAAMIASCCHNPIILVEPSDHYLEYLTKNAALFPNRSRIIKAIVTDGTVRFPSLEHHRGTARVVQGTTRHGDPIQQMRLGDVQGNGVDFVKIDADGWDFKIIEDSLDWIGKSRPVLYCEAEVDTIEDLAHANRVVERCRAIGFNRAALWDDAGCLVCATERIDEVGDLFRYLFECRRQPAQKRLFAYNVGLFHDKDREIFEQVAAYFRNGVPLRDGRVKLDE